MYKTAQQIAYGVLVKLAESSQQSTPYFTPDKIAPDTRQSVNTKSQTVMPATGVPPRAVSGHVTAKGRGSFRDMNTGERLPNKDVSAMADRYNADKPVWTPGESEVMSNVHARMIKNTPSRIFEDLNPEKGVAGDFYPAWGQSRQY